MELAKPRLLFLITTSDWGGAQFFVHALALEAKQRGFTVLVAAGGEGELGSICQKTDLRFVHLSTLRREISPLHDIAALHEIRRLIRDFKPTAVHLNSSKMSVIGSLAAWLERVSRVVYRIGGWSFLEDISPLKRWIYLTAEKWTASKKDIIVTVHPGDKKIAQTERIVPRQRLVTIPNGIDLVRFDRELLSREEARRVLGLSMDAFVIGTVANYYPPKDLPRYLQTLAPIVLAQPHLRAVIIGDGPEREAVLRSHEKLGLKDRVMLTGWRSDSAELSKAFDLFVLPSSKEGMPWSLLKAMAAGLPCIATDVGACRWMLEPDAGRLVPPKDSEALRGAIQKLIENPTERTQLGQAARQTVETRFRWESTLEKTLETLI